MCGGMPVTVRNNFDFMVKHKFIIPESADLFTLDFDKVFALRVSYDF
jgi:hypothetical protein